MAGFEAVFRSVLAEYLRSCGVESVQEVLSYEQDRRRYGSCSTCWQEETVLDIYFRTFEGGSEIYTYSGSIVDLINAL